MRPHRVDAPCCRGPPRPGADPHPLDNPAWAALTGPHAHLAERHGLAARYPADVSPFTALQDPADPRAWADLAELVGPGVATPVTGIATNPPGGWEQVGAVPGVQLVATALRSAADPDAVPLGPDDVPEMLDLIARTKPGPFLPRTIVLGRYLGLRSGGRLVAMAGERLHPPGWTEISAVCTDPDHRGRGLATRLVRAVAAGIRARGETPFLQAPHRTPPPSGSTSPSASPSAALRGTHTQRTGQGPLIRPLPPSPLRWRPATTGSRRSPAALRPPP